MAIFSIPNVKMVGLAACLPKKTVENKNFAWNSSNDYRLFAKTVGIEQRRIVETHQTAADLCFEAAEKLIEALQWNKNEIQVLVFVSQTPDHITPATAIMLQNRLNLPNSCLAFDINLGCSAYVYGLSVVSSLLSNMGFKKGLLLVGDTASKIVSLNDKSTTPIFADAGSATALECDTLAQPNFYFNLQSDGSGKEAIIVRDGGARNPFSENSLVVNDNGKGIARNRLQMEMNGLSVFNFTMREVVPNLNKLLEIMKKKTDDFDYFVFHQANKLLNERLRKKMKLESEKVPYSLQKYGNTSCATIPVTMVSELRQDLTTKKMNLILSGFGVGLSWGSVALKTDQVVCLEMLEI
ncbi:MAG: ketoacyl-ACP synthase III [Chitinophagales bacterium]